MIGDLLDDDTDPLNIEESDFADDENDNESLEDEADE